MIGLSGERDIGFILRPVKDSKSAIVACEYRSEIHFSSRSAVVGWVDYAITKSSNPVRDPFKDLCPFREFVDGPWHAETFRPNQCNRSFRIDRSILRVPKNSNPNRVQAMGRPFLGQDRRSIEGRDGITLQSPREITLEQLSCLRKRECNRGKLHG